MNYRSHVMLFERFENYDPTSGDPVAGTTQFSVYEAAGDPAWKVRHWTYTYTGDNPAPDPPDQEIGPYDVSIEGLSGGYTPATYRKNLPINIVLVIDKSGSMAGEKIEQTKEAAQTFVDMMREGDEIGVVSFDTQAWEVYRLSPITPGRQ